MYTHWYRDLDENRPELKKKLLINALVYGFAIPVDVLVDEKSLELKLENMSISQQFIETEKASNKKIIEHIEQDLETDSWKFAFYRYWIRNGIFYIGRNLVEDILEGGLDTDLFSAYHFQELEEDDLLSPVLKDYKPKIYANLE